MCVSGGKKCSYFGKFGVLCFLEKAPFGLITDYIEPRLEFFPNSGPKISEKVHRISVLFKP